MGLLEKRFGTVAVENLLISKDQLQKAFKIQLEENLAGKPHRLIGQILLELKFLTEEKVNKILLHLEGRQTI